MTRITPGSLRVPITVEDTVSVVPAGDFALKRVSRPLGGLQREGSNISIVNQNPSELSDIVAKNNEE